MYHLRPLDSRIAAGADRTDSSVKLVETEESTGAVVGEVGVERGGPVANASGVLDTVDCA